MPAPQRTTKNRSDPASREEAIQDISAETEQLVRERTAELQAENDELRRENATFRRVDAERTNLEAALRESEEKYARFFWDDLTADSLVSIDGWIQACNPAFLAVFGFSSLDEALGSKILPLYPDPKDRVDLLNLLRREKVLYHHELILRRRDGRLVNIVANMVGIFDDAGELAGTRAYMYDDTDRRRAEEILKESEERYRILVELSPDAILLHQDGGYAYVNPAAVRLFSASSPEDFADKDILDLVHPDYHAPINARTREILAKGRVSPMEVEINRFDGKRAFVESFRAQIRYKGRPASMLVMRDITDRKQAEMDLRRQTEDLARLNRDLESAQRETNLYLDILTHDIGNTENVSSLYSDLLIDTMDGEAAGYVEKLRRSIGKSIEILGTVSKIRRIHHGLPEVHPVDLDAVIREETGHYPDSNIRYEGVPCLVWADDLLQEVFANLIGNAVKHGGPGVAVTIGTQEENGFVRVSVEDTGPGVPDGEKEAIFHRYEQKKRGVGEGLGLYLVQILVERYGGKVWVEDRIPGHPEEGAAFRFTLKKA
jgi:PAS domain S-box-containing protein